jgi:hypothetical protein
MTTPTDKPLIHFVALGDSQTYCGAAITARDLTGDEGWPLVFGRLAKWNARELRHSRRCDACVKAVSADSHQARDGILFRPT